MRWIKIADESWTPLDANLACPTADEIKLYPQLTLAGVFGLRRLFALRPSSRSHNHDFRQSRSESFTLFFLKRVTGNELGFAGEVVSVRLSPAKSFPTLVVFEMASIQRESTTHSASRMRPYRLCIVKSSVAKSATAGAPTRSARLRCIA